MATTARRSAPERAYILHSHPYKETSLVIDVFTREHGRLAMVAKGAKRPGSALRAALLALQPLEIVWSGRGEVRTLAQATWQAGQPWLTGRALLCGMYLNELLIKLLPREDPHPRLFETYAATLMTLGAVDAEGEQAAVLREFEVALLAELGYALELEQEVPSGAALEADVLYRYDFERGPARTGHGPVVSGAALLALGAGRFASQRIANEARQFLQGVIANLLERRSIRSAKVMADLRELTQRLDSAKASARASRRREPAA